MPPAHTSERCRSLRIYLGGHATGTGSSNSCTTTAQAPSSGFPQIKLIVASWGRSWCHRFSCQSFFHQLGLRHFHSLESKSLRDSQCTIFPVNICEVLSATRHSPVPSLHCNRSLPESSCSGQLQVPGSSNPGLCLQTSGHLSLRDQGWWQRRQHYFMWVQNGS